MAKTLYGENDIRDIAVYLRGLTPRTPENTFEGDITKGKALFATCIACHGAELQGSTALHAPDLKNLNDWYMLAQLKKFKEGIRGANPADTYGTQMRAFAMTLVDEEAMRNVVAYIRSLAEELGP